MNREVNNKGFTSGLCSGGYGMDQGWGCLPVSAPAGSSLPQLPSDPRQSVPNPMADPEASVPGVVMGTWDCSMNLTPHPIPGCTHELPLEASRPDPH